MNGRVFAECVDCGESRWTRPHSRYGGNPPPRCRPCSDSSRPKKTIERTEKKCYRCGKIKPASDYYKTSRYDGLSAECKPCARVRRMANYTPEEGHRRQLAVYGVTPEGYADLLGEQDGVCAICKRPGTASGKRLSVDHDHQSGAVRALLCNNCNRGLGFFQDDPELLILAAAYLRRFT